MNAKRKREALAVRILSSEIWKELPAWGFYIRHADGVEFKNVTLKVLEEDYRPAIVADDVNGLKLDGVKIIQKDAEGKEQIITNQCKEITITE